MKTTLLSFYQNRKNRLGAALSAQIDPSEVYDREFAFGGSPIMLVGEAPGESEAKEGRPFCGPAGKNLSKLIASTKIQRGGILISNAFAFRTFEEGKNGIKNRTPNSSELKIGFSMLCDEIRIVKPKIIVLLGGSAEKAFCASDDKAVKNFVKELPKHEIKPFSFLGENLYIAKTHHPSPLVFNRGDKRQELFDFFQKLDEFAN